MSNGFVGRVQNVMQSLLPREHDFFALFHQLADQAQRAAALLEALLEDFDRLDLAVREIDQLEHEADTIVHEIVRKLDTTFVTPVLFDREDIYHMAESLDSIVDLVRATIDRFQIFRIPAPDEHTRALSRMITRAVQALHDALAQLPRLRYDQTDFCAQINTLENEGDAVLKRSLAELFEREPDAKQILKWKELYEFLEKTLDSCEDAANLLENVIVKNA